MSNVHYIEPKNPPLRIECEDFNKAYREAGIYMSLKKQIHISHENGVYIISVFGVKQ